MSRSKNPNRPGKSTGPRSSIGKASSSQNAFKHGCRSKKWLVGDEAQEELEAVRTEWLKEFEPEGYQEERLVEILIYNDWMFRRAQRNLLEAEAAMLGDVEGWTPELHHGVELMQRYKTSHERAFYRAWNALQGLRKEFMRRDMENVKLKARNEGLMKENQALKKQDKQPGAKAETPKTRAGALFQGQNSKKKLKKVYTLEQWVEVRIEDGKTVTTLYPSNAQLIEDGKKMYPPLDYVYRRINFPDEIPEEYHWVNKDPIARKMGGARRCDCPVCTQNAAILERVGA
jgi:hypothetical protein